MKRCDSIAFHESRIAWQAIFWILKNSIYSLMQRVIVEIYLVNYQSLEWCLNSRPVKKCNIKNLTWKLLSKHTCYLARPEVWKCSLRKQQTGRRRKHVYDYFENTVNQMLNWKIFPGYVCGCKDNSFSESVFELVNPTLDSQWNWKKTLPPQKK